MRKRLFLIFIAPVCLFPILRPAVITTDDHTGLLMLLRWQSGHIRFVNSVTEKPVMIHFRIRDKFRDFLFLTDETTENYYTSGFCDLNESLSAEATDTLRFCSVKGMSLRLGWHEFYLKDGGCLEVKLLWSL
ncbi:MAG: hypothetical protein BWK80_06670 [Desulfobacteraceae bacterium IS3]|nr:MAG: hypothetical protein BWK80_06670 [Desulfobacteraceae bacterium IS3]